MSHDHSHPTPPSSIHTTAPTSTQHRHFFWKAAELADPNCEIDEPNEWGICAEEWAPAVDVCLRHLAVALLGSTDEARADAEAEVAAFRTVLEKAVVPGWDAYDDEIDGRRYWYHDETGEKTYTAPTRQLDECLAYVRGRVGVPRDMGAAAALMLRAHLNWLLGLL